MQPEREGKLLTETEAMQQIRRLSGLTGWPKANAAQAELAKALAQAVGSNHAREVINNLLADSEFCPKPCTILRLLAMSRVRYDSGPTRECAKCKGGGWLRGTVNGYDESVGIRYETATKCQCGAADREPDYGSQMRQWKAEQDAGKVENIRLYGKPISPEEEWLLGALEQKIKLALEAQKQAPLASRSELSTSNALLAVMEKTR
jgi:hypothetical protein